MEGQVVAVWMLWGTSSADNGVAVWIWRTSGVDIIIGLVVWIWRTCSVDMED